MGFDDEAGEFGLGLGRFGDRAIALTAEVFGDDSETVALIRGEVDERMPVVPGDDTVGYR